MPNPIVNNGNFAGLNAAGHNVVTASHHYGASFWSEFIARTAESAGIDPSLAVQLAHQESGLDPHAVNHSSGALGIMQLMPGTAAELGVDPHNVVENIRGGLHYLGQQLSRFGNAAQAVAAYNWGPRNVARAIAHWGENWLEHAPHETRQYVSAILSKTGGDPAAMGEAGTALASNSLPAPPPGAAALQHRDLVARAQMRSAVSAYLLSTILE